MHSYSSPIKTAYGEVIAETPMFMMELRLENMLSTRRMSRGPSRRSRYYNNRALPYERRDQGHRVENRNDIPVGQPALVAPEQSTLFNQSLQITFSRKQ